MKINTNSNAYTIVYSIVMVVIVALLLAVVSAVLKPRQEMNVALDEKKQVLSSLNERGLSDAEAEQTYKDQITEVSCEKCGLSWMEANLKGEKKYIVKVSGVGLWGGIRGYIALDADKNTIYGVYFNHDSETPGLGAEIKEEPFQHRFEGKKLRENGEFIRIVKGIPEGNEVEAVSGATITSKGVEAMIANSFAPYVEAGFFAEPETADTIKKED